MEENNVNVNNLKKSTPIFPKDKSLSPVTLRDLILFKEDMLKEMKIYENKANNSILKNFEKYNNLLEECNNKLYHYERDNVLFMKQINFVEEKNKIMTLIEEKEKDIKNQIMVNDLHIKTIQKEFYDACFKYDRTIVDNLLIPGLVGKGCKFPFFKEYINDIQGQINNAFSQIKQTGNNLNAHKTITDGQIKQINSKIKQLEYESRQFTSEKTILLENRFNQMIEDLKKQIINISVEFTKKKYDLKTTISDIKKISNLIIEENKKINVNTLTEFEKIKKQFTKLKKSIVELSSLLTQGGKHSGKDKYNQNIASNRQLIIEQFNGMIIDLMKDVTRRKNSTEFNNELNNVLFPKKKVGSVIKKYIDGQIKAENTRYEDKDKSRKNINNISNSNSPNKKKIDSLTKNGDFKFSRLNSDIIKTDLNFKKFNRQLSHGFKGFQSNFDTNYHNIDSGLKIKNVLSDNKNSQIHVIKEEKNNISNSFSDSIFDDSEIDNEEKDAIIKDTIYAKYYGDKNDIFNIKAQNSQKDKKKLFRAATSNYDNKFINKMSSNNNSESYKLILKAQENLMRKSLEKKKTFKNESVDSNKIEKKYTKDDKIKNLNIINEIPDFKSPEKTEKESKDKIIDINKKEDDTKNEDYSNNISITVNKQNFIEENANKNEETNNNKNEENLRTSNLKKEEKSNINNNQKQSTNIHHDNISPTPIKSKNMTIYMKNFYPQNQFAQIYNGANIPKKSAFSSDSDLLKNSKIRKNKDIKTNITKEILAYDGNFNNKISHTTNNNRTQNNINYSKNTIINLTNRKKPFSIENSSHNRPLSKYRIKKGYDEDLFVNKDMINQLNYCKDEDIIDIPLLTNQTEFKVDNTKGNLENKILELEHFTKKKFDELVKEIKNFIPIHFNAYIKF